MEGFSTGVFGIWNEFILEYVSTQMTPHDQYNFDNYLVSNRFILELIMHKTLFKIRELCA